MIFIENVAKNDREKKIQLIAFEVIKVLKRRFDNFPREDINNRNAPFHEAFLRAFKNEFAQKNITDTPFLISLASWLHGLNTTLGQSFFESVAHILSDGEKRSFKGYKIKESQQKAARNALKKMKKKDILDSITQKKEARIVEFSISQSDSSTENQIKI